MSVSVRLSRGAHEKVGGQILSSIVFPCALPPPSSERASSSVTLILGERNFQNLLCAEVELLLNGRGR